MTDNSPTDKSGIDANSFYVSNGEQTTGPYTGEDRAYRRKYRYNNEPQYDGTWLVFRGDEVRDDDNIPLPK